MWALTVLFLDAHTLESTGGQEVMQLEREPRVGSVLTLVGAPRQSRALRELGPRMDRRHTGSEAAGARDRAESRFNGLLQHLSGAFQDALAFKITGYKVRPLVSAAGEGILRQNHYLLSFQISSCLFCTTFNFR